MISWMQKNRKYLVVTIWISTIAFVGAGFVGWGQYSYGDRSKSIAKIGDVHISAKELNDAYSIMFNHYNEMFNNQLDEPKAKELGLDKMAFNQLINQALVLNLAKEFKITVTDDELLSTITSQPIFFSDGVFNKDIYSESIRRSGKSKKEYEESLRKEILIQKIIFLLSSPLQQLEKDSIAKALSISDKIEYKLLKPQDIEVILSDEMVKNYWQETKDNYKSDKKYNISYFIKESDDYTPSDDEIESFYSQNRELFKDLDGKMLSIDESKSQIIAEISMKNSEKEALKNYIEFKKGSNDSSFDIKKASIAQDNSIFDNELTQKILDTKSANTYIKPHASLNGNIIVRVDEIVPSQPKSYEEAKDEAMRALADREIINKLQTKAQESYKTFSGTKTDFITSRDIQALSDISPQDASEFLQKLFLSKEKRGFITLSSKNVILYNIVEQKLLDTTLLPIDNTALEIKESLLNQELLKILQSKYPAKIYVEGI